MTEANSLLQVPGPCNPCPLRLNLSSLNYLFMQNPWAHAGLCKYLCEHGKAYTSFISAITASEYKDLCLSLLAKFKHHMDLILFTNFLIDLRAFKSYIPNVLRPTPLPSLTLHSQDKATVQIPSAVIENDDFIVLITSHSTPTSINNHPLHGVRES